MCWRMWQCVKECSCCGMECGSVSECGSALGSMYQVLTGSLVQEWCRETLPSFLLHLMGTEICTLQSIFV